MGLGMDGNQEAVLSTWTTTMKRFCALMCVGLVMVFATVLLTTPPLATASGSYSGRPPKPPEHIDAAKYELGKNLFNGKTTPSATGASKAEQAKRLGGLQEKLPKRVQQTVNLPALAGKLAPAEQQALEYYLSVRYKVK